MKKTISTILLCLAVACFVASVTMLFVANRPMQVSYTDFIEDASSPNIASISIGADQRTVDYVMDDAKMQTVIMGDLVKIIALVSKNNPKVKISVDPPESSGGPSILLMVMLAFIPTLLLIGFFFWMAKKQQAGAKEGGGPMGDFAKSKARKIDPEDIKITFDQVALGPEDRKEIEELVEFLKCPADFKKVNAQIPKGILMCGPPGTGKTMVARAMAKEAGVPFFSAAGSEFDDMYVGVGAGRIRSMFAEARKEERAIIFIDEIDCLAPNRSTNTGGSGNGQTINQLLTEMDGFEGNETIIVIGATNRADKLDPAVTRPGRFDRIVSIDLPDLETRKKIISIHLENVVQYVSQDDVEKIARGTPGFSGAELSKLVNEAAIFAARSKAEEVTFDDLERAKDKVMMGCESPRKMNPEEVKLTAYHEAGHAIAGFLSPEHDEVYKVSIIPRDRSLGVTMFMPEDDKYSLSKTGIHSQILTLLAGRAAEEIVKGDGGITTGASNDIERATQLARSMVKRWGLSGMGLAHYGLQSNGSGNNSYSDSTCAKIDEEVDNILKGCYSDALELLKSNKVKLDAMADMLVEHETIDEADIQNIMATGTDQLCLDLH